MLKPVAWGFRVESGRSLEQARTTRPIEQTRPMKKSCGLRSITSGARFRWAFSSARASGHPAAGRFTGAAAVIMLRGNTVLGES